VPQRLEGSNGLRPLHCPGVLPQSARGTGLAFVLVTSDLIERSSNGLSDDEVDVKEMVSFVERLRQEVAKMAAAETVDPWRLPLERVHGKIGDDGIERITTQQLFDILEVPQRSRGAGACRRLAKLMAELGWMAVRVRGLTRGGYLEQVRGYAREPQSRLLFHHC
jgi:hypothetical protein